MKNRIRSDVNYLFFPGRRLAMNGYGIQRRWTPIHKICHISVNANLAICLELGLVATVGLVHLSPALTAKKESKYSN